MKWIDRMKAGQARESAALAQNGEAVENANRQMFLLVLSIGICLFGTLLILTFCMEDFYDFRLTNAVIVISFLLLYLLSNLPSMNAPSSLWLYCSFFV